MTLVRPVAGSARDDKKSPDPLARLLALGRPVVMGVLNVTPDSFSDGGRFLDPAAAIEHGRRLRADGAAWVDVGGESTRPGAEPVVEALSDDMPVSIDTTKPAVARAAVAAGARLINDVSASLHEVAAETGAG